MIMDIVSMAFSLALALRSGRSLAVADVFGAGKTRSLTFLLAWLALTTHLKIAVVHKENPLCSHQPGQPTRLQKGTT